jgi:hypothetical protein
LYCIIDEIHRIWTIGDGVFCVFCVFCEEEKKRREEREEKREEMQKSTLYSPTEWSQMKASAQRYIGTCLRLYSLSSSSSSLLLSRP